MGLGSYIAAVKDKLTAEHKRVRLAFARRYVRYPAAFWRSVIFSDEKSWSSSAHGRIRVRRQCYHRFDTENILTVKKSGRTSVSVWAGMSWTGGLTPLRRVAGNLTAVQYTAILDDTLMPYVAENFPDQPFIFMQDK